MAPKLHIAFYLKGVPDLILMSQMVALPGTELGPVIGSASAWRDDIVATVDLLVSGF